MSRCLSAAQSPHLVLGMSHDVHVQARTLSPILWLEDFRREQLKGSPTLNEARDREVQIREEWASIMDSVEARQFPSLDKSWFNEQSFLEAFAVIVAHAVYLPSAQCFALLPYVSFMGRTGNDNGCEVDYDEGANVLSVLLRNYPVRLCCTHCPGIWHWYEQRV
jgi:hypothetical protein